MEPSVQADLARVQILSLAAVLACQIIPAENGAFTVPAEGPVEGDYVPQLEYLAEKGLFLNGMADGWQRSRDDFSPRASTLLAAYLRQHELSDFDLKTLVAMHLAHQMPEPRLFRSLLESWLRDPARPPFPVDLWPAASESSDLELKVIRLAPLLNTMIQVATSNPEPLRIYAGDWMEAYRAGRSVFNLPPAAQLESVLQRLIEVDPGRQRLYKLNLAELAWDRGDDPLCFAFGQAALGSTAPVDANLAGPLATATDAVIYRMADSCTRAGKRAEAWNLLQTPQVQEVLKDPGSHSPLLELISRRLADRGSSTSLD
jgi:hypothetical protein